jgi:23S rRNA (guanosine2251-2'-O)-methyltransferase
MDKTTHIYGTRAVIEALEAGKAIDKIFLQKGYQGAQIQELQSLARKKGVRVSVVPSERLARFRDRNHQGSSPPFHPWTSWTINNSSTR